MKTKTTTKAIDYGYPKTPKEMIEQLDRWAKESSEVALLTSYGLIYPWQKYKLQNLQSSIKHGGLAVGFIELHPIYLDNWVNYLTIATWPFNGDKAKSGHWQALLGSSARVFSSYEQDHHSDPRKINAKWEFASEDGCHARIDQFE
jgi:hypothetical protein